MDQLNLAQCKTCACANLRGAARAVTRLYDDILRPSGLQATQFTLLVTIALAGTAPITQLAKVLVMDRTTLTRNLKPLEKQGLVQVAPGEDQRMRLVTLTEPGQQALTKALPLWEKAQVQAVKVLGAERFRALLTDLSAIASLAG
jgi:DNA-binding MarR family transcriptional regulator